MDLPRCHEDGLKSDPLLTDIRLGPGFGTIPDTANGPKVILVEAVLIAIDDNSVVENLEGYEVALVPPPERRSTCYLLHSGVVRTHLASGLGLHLSEGAFPNESAIFDDLVYQIPRLGRCIRGVSHGSGDMGVKILLDPEGVTRSQADEVKFGDGVSSAMRSIYANVSK